MVAPEISIVIPYDSEANLGKEYDWIMRESSREWILFLDHDVLILNPHWYHLCQEAIRKYPDAGLFVANGNCGSRFQNFKNSPAMNQPIAVHLQFARDLWNKNKYSCTQNDSGMPGQQISGFFMLTCKTVWAKTEGFGRDGLFGHDRLYYRRIIAAGHKCYRINGIYCYHLRDRIDGSWIPGLKTSKELWNEYREEKT